MFTRNVALLAGAAVVTVVLTTAAAPAAGVMPLTRTDNLTFSGAVALPGVVLPAGTYAFEAGPQGTNANIVRVTTMNRQKVLFLGFTIPVRRAADSVRVSLGEASPGQPAPIKVWYPIDSDTGHEFLYR